jgi:hypothetical protein
MQAVELQVNILYNGVTRPLEVRDHERIADVLQHAIHLFGITQGPHLLSLFRVDGTKLEEQLTVEQAHIHTGEELVLRPDVVKGGLT